MNAPDPLHVDLIGRFGGNCQEIKGKRRELVSQDERQETIHQFPPMAHRHLSFFRDEKESFKQLYSPFLYLVF
jgi:hypothetical protein